MKCLPEHRTSVWKVRSVSQIDGRACRHQGRHSSWQGWRAADRKHVKRAEVVTRSMAYSLLQKPGTTTVRVQKSLYKEDSRLSLILSLSCNFYISLFKFRVFISCSSAQHHLHLNESNHIVHFYLLPYYPLSSCMQLQLGHICMLTRVIWEFWELHARLKAEREAACPLAALATSAGHQSQMWPTADTSSQHPLRRSQLYFPPT